MWNKKEVYRSKLHRRARCNFCKKSWPKYATISYIRSVLARRTNGSKSKALHRGIHHSLTPWSLHSTHRPSLVSVSCWAAVLSSSSIRSSVSITETLSERMSLNWWRFSKPEGIVYEPKRDRMRCGEGRSGALIERESGRTANERVSCVCTSCMSYVVLSKACVTRWLRDSDKHSTAHYTYSVRWVRKFECDSFWNCDNQRHSMLYMLTQRQNPCGLVPWCFGVHKLK